MKREKTNRQTEQFNHIKTPNTDKRAFFIQTLRASATVEAALVIPLFLYAVLAIAYAICMLDVRLCISRTLYEDTKDVAKYAYVLRQQEKQIQPEVLYAKALFGLRSGIAADYAKEHYIVGGSQGVLLTNCDFMSKGNEITLTAQYALKNPFDLFHIGVKTVKHSYTTAAWCGADYEKGLYGDEEQSEIVYITAEGAVYHTHADCTYLQPSITEIFISALQSHRNESGAIYYACERCGHGATEQEMVYITTYGNRYHMTSNCSELKRTVLKTKKHLVEDRRQCSKCAKY